MSHDTDDPPKSCVRGIRAASATAGWAWNGTDRSPSARHQPDRRFRRGIGHRPGQAVRDLKPGRLEFLHCRVRPQFLLHDVSRIVNGGETNYIIAATGVYMSLFNIFVSLLNLLLAFSGQRD